MVFPVGGSPQQQVPAANTFQPGGAETVVKRPDDNKAQDSTRPQGAPLARSEKADNRNSDATYKAAANDRSEDNGSATANTSRGQNLDITA